MKTITLTQDKAALVDDEDYEWLSQWKWQARKNHCTFYATRNGKRRNGKRLPAVYMHRAVLDTVSSMETDHIDGDGLNNQKYNLRECTRQQNSMNCRGQKNVSSIYKGVHWDKRRNNWVAAIKRHKKSKTLGAFLSQIEAAKAYDVEAIRLFGGFARPNFQL